MDVIVRKVKNIEEFEQIEKALSNFPDSVKKGIISVEMNASNDYVIMCHQSSNKLNVLNVIDSIQITKTLVTVRCRCYIFVFEIREDLIKYEIDFHSVKTIKP